MEPAMQRPTFRVPERTKKGPKNRFGAALWLIEQRGGFEKLPKGAWMRALSRAGVSFGGVETLLKQWEDWNKARAEKRASLLRAERHAEAKRFEPVPAGAFLWPKLTKLAKEKCSDPTSSRLSSRPRPATPPPQLSLFGSASSAQSRPASPRRSARARKTKS